MYLLLKPLNCKLHVSGKSQIVSHIFRYQTWEIVTVSRRSSVGTYVEHTSRRKVVTPVLVDFSHPIEYSAYAAVL